jgi:hypothetical protein
MRRFAHSSVCFALVLCALLSTVAATPLGAASANYLGIDTTTKGNWKGVYGQDGNVIAQHSVQAPTYSTFDTRNVSLYLLDLWSTDPRSLLKFLYSYSASERIASFFHSASYLDIIVSATDNQPHRVALYFCDWTYIGRSVTVETRDYATDALFDTRQLTDYTGGVYLIYSYNGGVYFRVKNNNVGLYSPTASVSAVFWGGGVPVADTTPPTISITAPGTGASLAGAVSILVSANDNVGVAGVQYKLDGANLGAEQTTPPFTFSWNTTGTSNGAHTLTAVARDAMGNTGNAAPVDITVNNPPPDVIQPVVSITTPANNAVLIGSVNLTASAFDAGGVAGVQYKLDGANLGAEQSVSPYTLAWSTTGTINGAHTLTAVARDNSGNLGTSSAINVTVNNPPADVTPPTVSIATPANNAVVSGSVNLTASAFDSVGVVGVQYKLDGANLGPELAVAPYSYAWNTVLASNGSHSLTAVARDLAGNQGNATAITVTVSNAVLSGNGVTFLGTDTTTKGNWRGVYGQDGSMIAYHSVNVPAYAGFDTQNTNSYMYDLWSTDPRAPFKAVYSYSPTERVASYFYSRFYMEFLVTAYDTSEHRIALYFCDWDYLGRNITLEVKNADTSALLDSRVLNNYGGGVYLVYNYRGRVIFRVNNNNPPVTPLPNPNATISAMFWGGSGLPVVDNTPPTISITAPTNNAIVLGTVNVTVNAQDNIAVAGVQYKLDGNNLGAEVTSAPFSLAWNTVGAVNGAHTLTAVARDGAGNTGQSAGVPVTVNNPPPDLTPPTVAVTAPANNATVTGSVNLTASAFDSGGIAGVQYKLDGANLGAEQTVAPYTLAWNTATATNGAHTLSAVARDNSGNTAPSAAITVTVSNAPPPSGNFVAFLGTDTITKGNWKGVYGQDGNMIAQHSVMVPTYATFDPRNVGVYLYDLWSTDPRAPLKQYYSYSATERVASFLQSVTYMDFVVSATDAQLHRIALYFCDFTYLGRSITVEARDAVTDVILDTRPLTDYTGGVYLVYTYRGQIYFKVRNNTPSQYSPTATVSAFFWGGSGLP